MRGLQGKRMVVAGGGGIGGATAIHEFTELRWITIQTTPRKYPF